MFKTLRKVLIGFLIISSFLTVNAFADEASQNQQLYQYYSTLAKMGGNESVSKEDAQTLADYYASLISGSSKKSSKTPVSSTTTLYPVNVNASNEFYNATVARLNSLPEFLKQKIAKHQVTFYLYDRGENYGADYYTGGLTESTMIYGRRSRKCEFDVSLSEHCANEYQADFILYHELGHVVNYLIWENTGTCGEELQEFEDCLLMEYQDIRNISGYNNVSDDYGEYFADAFAEYYLRNDALRNRCSYTYYFFSTLAY